MPAPPLPGPSGSGVASSSKLSQTQSQNAPVRITNVTSRKSSSANVGKAMDMVSRQMASSSIGSGRTSSGGGVVVNTPASGSGSGKDSTGTMRPAMMMAAKPAGSAGTGGMTPFVNNPAPPKASTSSQQAPKMSAKAAPAAPAAVPKASNGSGESQRAESACLVCSAKPWHKLKQCPVLLQGPAKCVELFLLILLWNDDADRVFFPGSSKLLRSLKLTPRTLEKPTYSCLSRGCIRSKRLSRRSSR